MTTRTLASRSSIAACLMFLAMSLACSESDIGEGPLDPKDEPSPYSGTFYVRTVVTETSCRFAVPIDGPTPITVKGDSITVGSMRGTWDGMAKRGTGSDPAPMCIPIGECIGCSMLAFDIVFASVDSFAGAYYLSFTYSQCDVESCHTRYSVTGTR